MQPSRAPCVFPGMSSKHYVANAILWASAIVASALAGAGPAFSEILLALAASALLVTWPSHRTDHVPK